MEASWTDELQQNWSVENDPDALGPTDPVQYDLSSPPRNKGVEDAASCDV